MESEYVAAALAAKEAIWTRSFINELHKHSKMRIANTHDELGVPKPVSLFSDNMAAIRVAKNAEFHKKAKHIEISFHFLRQRVQIGQVDMNYISTKQMPWMRSPNLSQETNSRSV